MSIFFEKKEDNRFYNKNSVRKILGESSKIDQKNQINSNEKLARKLQNEFNKQKNFVIPISKYEINKQINSNAIYAKKLQNEFNSKSYNNQNYLLQKELQNHYNHVLALELQNNEYKKAFL